MGKALFNKNRKEEGIRGLDLIHIFTDILK